MSQGNQVVYLESSGIERRYVLHVPASYDAARAWPLLLMLDGRGGTPWTAMKITGWNTKADACGFIAAYPEAMKLNPHGPQHFLENPQMWNAGTGGSDAERTGPDDVLFLRGVIADICGKFNVDRSRIFMAGFSNGASMTFRFALEAPELVAAIACLSGHFRSPGLKLREPVPLIYFFGEADPLSPVHGGRAEMPWGGTEVRPSAQSSVNAWIDLLGLDRASMADNSENGVCRKIYGPRDDGAEVQFYTIDDLGHVWPGGHRLLPEKIGGAESHKLIANDVIWDFFSARPKRRA
jgi:polyhydroxybutyrate depolymerase